MHPGTVVSVVNSYAATSEYTPARFVNRVDFPTDGNPAMENNNILNNSQWYVKQHTTNTHWDG